MLFNKKSPFSSIWVRGEKEGARKERGVGEIEEGKKKKEKERGGEVGGKGDKGREKQVEK